MKKNIFAFSVFILFVNNMPYAAGQRLREEHQLIIKPFVDAFKNNDRNAAARLIHYPFEQTYPLKSIENENEMLLRFDEIFDRELIDRIKNSSLENDWSSAGWRGITLGSGTVWIDYDGKMITTNYTTKAQLDMWERALQRDREKLYVSLRDYNRPVGLYSSDTYKIRIDQVKNNTFRLVLWRTDQMQSEKPELIIEDGIQDIQGSMGNTYYLFNDNKKYYILYAGGTWHYENLTFKIMKYPNFRLEELSVFEIMEIYSIRGPEYFILDENIKLIYETE